ncbi:hypothetical protein M1563_00005, partial [Patescibacteria group bacterium]|nr:hypothetical protein [Patescibacteria group bacterium]
TGENIDYFRKLNTDESGRVKMINWGEEGYGSEAEVKAEGGLIREHGKFYVLQEGTVDKNRKHSPDRRIELAAKSS